MRVSRRKYWSSQRVFAAIVVSLIALFSPAVEAQSLKGSSQAVGRAYKVALDHKLPFFKTPADVKRLVKAGHLAQVTQSQEVALHRVSFPVALPSVVTFINRLAAGYIKGCGEQLVVTSLSRPLSKQPKNASTRSVHPAGMAVDIRRSKIKKCRAWLEDVLLDLEAEGVLEATRERRPPHYHIAIFPTKYTAYVGRLGKGKAHRPHPEDQEPGDYVVQTGESLWAIAHRFGTTVERLKALNGLDHERIDAGQHLLVPRRRQSAQAPE